jgi:hypothetical protein
MNATGARLLGVVAVVVLTTSADASAPTGRYVTAGGTVYDTKTKLTWQQTVSSKTYTWVDAKTYCVDVGASLGGTGWRLPTIKELQTIVDESRCYPSMDPTAFSATPGGWFFWSSSPVAALQSSAWFVNFSDGSAYHFAVSNASNVRCVR